MKRYFDITYLLKKPFLSILRLLFFICFFGQPEISSSRMVYLLIGTIAIISCVVIRSHLVIYDDCFPEKQNTNPRVLHISSILFGMIVAFANYQMYVNFSLGIRLLMMLILTYSSIATFLYSFLLFDIILSKKVVIRPVNKLSPLKLFGVCFITLSSFYLLVFFLCSYPGQICSDSINQIKQIIYNNYSNHHPVYHTWLIRLFFNLGMYWFKEINAAIAVYSVFQIVFISATFAFSIMTIFQAGCRRIVAFFWLVWFLLCPCHIIFSFTLWKDSIYGAVVCLFTTAFFRYTKHIGKYPSINCILLSVTSVGFCLLRSNGFPAFIIFFFFAVITKNVERKILLFFLTTIICSYMLKYPMLKSLSISQTDTVEMLSIPVQQIAKVASETNDFTFHERSIIEQIVPVERLCEQYNPKIYDDIKNIIRLEGNQDYISNHPIQCFFVWLSVVARHPLLAVEAWIDQTSGYWNPCSSYWMKWWDGVCEEEGLKLTVYSEKANTIFHSYVKAFTNTNAVLILSYNIGLHVWIILLCLIWCRYHQRNEYVIALPVLSIIITLLLATVMHDEFRLGYPVYTCLPVITFCTLSTSHTRNQTACDPGGE